MAKSFYEVLGVATTSTGAEIRSAHRQMVLLYHPDTTTDPRAREKFFEITRAYETLSDPIKRKEYDLLLGSSAPKQAKREPEPERVKTKTADAQSEVLRLSVLFSRGSYQEAERVARRVIKIDPRQPVPYAVLGDLARSRGELKEASKMYAFAIQMDPSNAIYSRRYEELLGRVAVTAGSSTKPKRSVAALAGGGTGVLFAGSYLAVSRETSIFSSLPQISSWTLGLLLMTFLSGVALGTSLAAGEWLDRFGESLSNSLGKPAPWLALATVAIVSFWVASVLYTVISVAQRSANVSTSRILLAVALGVGVLSGFAYLSPGLSASQVFLWSGNVMYMGAICGWMVTDALRKAS